jgi:glycerol-3-phosphate acyltransferase PlsY
MPRPYIMAYIAFLLSYMLGAIPFGVLVGKARGVDIRSVGSGNSGATNVWRTLGPVAGTTVFILDVLKGLAAPFIARELVGSQEYSVIAICAALAVIGHTFSCFLKFRGGKGIATGHGMALGLMPLPALLAFALWGIVLLLSRMISVASIIAAAAAPLLALWLKAPTPYVVVITIISLIAIIKHIPNMKRIAAGTEPRVGGGKSTPAQAAGVAEIPR